MTVKGYNGWTNYETWNVALWLQNEYWLYNVTKSYYMHKNPFWQLRKSLRDNFEYSETGDGVSLFNPSLNVFELNQMITEMVTD
tara:strand:+ start:1043 stop:1294 length:252 start_codon:yes stop_codon:yes gene_type:complete